MTSFDASGILDEVDALDSKQLGSIRHIVNLANQPPNDWSHMMPYLPMQEDHGAYRYQLAYMAFALALGYRHRLPAAPAVFKDAFDKLIEKMVHPEVWLYWRDTSRGKGHNAVDAPELPSELDPVRRDNIMYSAYLQVMTLLYHALFGDDKYTRENSIEFRFEPLMCLYDQHQVIGYDEKSLNETIYWNMVESGYLGVACEPFCIFQICNQVPIIGFRLHDYLYGTSLAEETIHGYRRAWEQFGGPVGEDGHYTTIILSHKMAPAQGDTWGPWSDSWLTMLRNSWDGAFVRETYLKQRDTWLVPGPENTLSVAVQPNAPGVDIPLGAWGDLGWIVGAMSEMGDRDSLDRIFAYTDHYMETRWDRGGFFYPRNDIGHDCDGNFTAMSPTIGNAMMQYARLNVEDGLKMLYDEPLPPHHREQPAIESISAFADVSRARYLTEERALVVSLSAFDGREEQVRLGLSNIVEAGPWAIHLNGERAAIGEGLCCKEADSRVAVGADGDQLVLALVASQCQDIVLQLGA